MPIHGAKLKAVILYISRHPAVRDLGLTKLYKLIFFADAFHLREYGESITGSEYIKYQHGPVPSRAERCIKALRREELLETEKIPFGGYEMTSVRPLGTPPTFDEFSSEELATLDAVCKQFGRLTATSLSERSHREPAWMATKLLEKIAPELIMYGTAEDPDGL